MYVCPSDDKCMTHDSYLQPCVNVTVSLLWSLALLMAGLWRTWMEYVTGRSHAYSVAANGTMFSYCDNNDDFS